MTDSNTLRRLNYLWKNRHNHDADTTVAEITEIRVNIGEADKDQVAAPGAFIHLTLGANQSIAVAGEDIDWDTLHPFISPLAFADPTLPTTTVTIPIAGYYNVAVEAAWDTHTAGGTVEVRRTRDGNTVVVAPTDNDPDLWTATNGQRGAWVAHGIPCEVGDTISVYIDHDTGGALNLAKGTLTVYKVESGRSVGNYRALVLSHGPESYWRLGESSGTNAADEMGNHDGTYTDTPTLGATGLITNDTDTSVEFDGANEYVEIDDIADGLAGQTELTIEAWINADSFSSAIVRINRDFPATTGDNVYGITAHTNGAFRWVDQNDTLDSTAGDLTVDTKHYVAATRDSSDVVRLYVDGVLVKTGSTSGTTALATDIAQIGMDWDDLGGTPTETQHFDGHIDEVAVYKRALTAHEIAEHWFVGNGGGI